MNRIAAFVDAGYFFAQGSVSIWGAKQLRNTLVLNETSTVNAFVALAKDKAPEATLLRIYWYDGARHRGPTLEQLRLAALDNIKLRLGSVNSQGQQKGVDSLIVTDLVELARNQAVSDAILLAGDEDVRIGVLLAQSFGVRVHLLGIIGNTPSQSPQLIQESDTTAEWDSTMMAKMLSQKPQPAASAKPVSTSTSTPAATAAALSGPGAVGVSPDLDTYVDTFIASLSPADVTGIKAYWAAKQRGIPGEIDGKLLAQAGAALAGC